MSYIGYVLIGLLAAVAAAMIYVRLAPTRARHWHEVNLPVLKAGHYAAVGGHLVQQPVAGDGKVALERLDAVIRSTPRTRVLAGSRAEGRITYVTRSLIWGFPDLTTVTLAENPATGENMVQIFGRLRFGRADFGVNRTRIEGWLEQLDRGKAAARAA